MITLTHTKQISETVGNRIAQQMNYSPFIYDKDEDGGGHKNEETEEQFLNRKYQEHCDNFSKFFEDKEIEEAIAPQIEVLREQLKSELNGEKLSIDKM